MLDSLEEQTIVIISICEIIIHGVLFHIVDNELFVRDQKLF